VDTRTVSVTAALTEEAREEVRNKLGSRDYYIDTNNRVFFSGESDVTKLTMGTLTQ